MNSALARLNQASPANAIAAFTRCCGASRWAEAMAARRPYSDDAALLGAAEAAWPLLTEAGWREAFGHHPKIGDLESLRMKFADTGALAAQEQGQVAAAEAPVLHALAEANRRYEEKFGYIFIVCATGKSAAEMLALLHSRLPNLPEMELPIAAEEQKKITRLRLQALLTG
jgi:2-oxo-4-hydroxy-4-carboxy-5-ureidoimidazoline decarboxylase